MTVEWVSIPVAAQLRGVSEKTIHNWIDADLISARTEQHGRQRRRFVDKAELLAFAQSQDRQSEDVGHTRHDAEAGTEHTMAGGGVTPIGV